MRVLIVCSGNTCRSPLAAAILADLVATDPALTGISVSSAGTSARAGAPASEGSFLVALERELDLSAHAARELTAELVKASDLILTMGAGHARQVAELGGADRVHLLTSFAGDDGSDVPDPFGQDVSVYRETAERLERLMARVAARLRQGRAP